MAASTSPMIYLRAHVNRQVSLTLGRGRSLMHGVAPRMCGQVARPLLGGGAGGRSPGLLFPSTTYLAATNTIQYVATDQSGLTSTSTRIVIIEPAASSVATTTEPTSTASTTQ